jgi:hypothetical protein
MINCSDCGILIHTGTRCSICELAADHDAMQQPQMLHTAWYLDHMYPGDTYILGVYDSEEKAERAIESAMSAESNPRSHRKKRYNYSIHESTLNDE